MKIRHDTIVSAVNMDYPIFRRANPQLRQPTAAVPFLPRDGGHFKFMKPEQSAVFPWAVHRSGGLPTEWPPP